MSRLVQIDGLPVLDATHDLTIHVTRTDIRGADPKRPEACAVARACLRELHCYEARVHLARLYVRTNKTNWQRYFVPPSMRAEIIAFDRGGRFVPSTFTVRAVPKGETIGARAKRAASKHPPGPRPPPKSRRNPPHVIKDVRAGPA